MAETVKSKELNWNADAPTDAELNSRSWLRLDRRTSLITLGAAAGVFGIVMLQFDAIEAFPFWLMVLFFAMMIWLRSTWALTSVFVVLLTIKFFDAVEFSGPRPFGSPLSNSSTGPLGLHLSGLGTLSLFDLAFTLSALLFAGASLRFLDVHKYNLGYFSEFGMGEGKTFADSNRRFPSLLGGRWLGIFLAIAAAVLLLQVYPLDLDTVKKYWIRPRAMRVIFLIGSVFLVWFLIRGLFQLMMRWTMDSDQASVHMRSIYASEYWKGHASVEKRLAKINRKQQMANGESEINDVD